MQRQRSSINFFSRMKRRVSHISIHIDMLNIEIQYLGRSYRSISPNEHREITLSSLSSDKFRRTSYDSDYSLSEQSHCGREINDDLEDELYCSNYSTKRILSQNSEQKFELFYIIHYGFTKDQSSIIENALQIVADRLFKPEILENMYEICGKSGCCLAQGVLSHSNLLQTTIWFNKHLLLEYQFMCLKTSSEDGGFPIINIFPKHGNYPEVNNNLLPCVSCISHDSTFLIDGEFEIELDSDKLDGSVKNSANALFWAGEIVNEMLQNLGHQSNGISCTKRPQSHVFKQCFLFNGNYIPIAAK